MLRDAMPDLNVSLSYIVLKTALAKFQKSPLELSKENLTLVTKQAQAQLKVQSAVLQSEIAGNVSIPESVLQSSLDEIVQRYEDEEAFLQDLTQNGMDMASFRTALKRELHVNAVLDRVASQSEKISELDASIYYHMHREKFSIPEKRKISHILITVNDDFEENNEAQALERIQGLHQSLKVKPKKFSDLALKHSECPTALQGGALGELVAGTLFPELDCVAFQMKKDEISEVLRSEVGFHILKCESISPKQTVGLKQALPKILAVLQERQDKNCQRNWLAEQFKNMNK